MKSMRQPYTKEGLRRRIRADGFVTVYALIISMLIFSLLTIVVISFSSQSKINKNHSNSIEGNLMVESIGNMLETNEAFQRFYANKIKGRTVFSTNTIGEFTMDLAPFFQGKSVVTAYYNKKDDTISFQTTYRNKKVKVTGVYEFERYDNPIEKDEPVIKVDREFMEKFLQGRTSVATKNLNGDFVFMGNGGVTYYIENSQYILWKSYYDKYIEEYNASLENDEPTETPSPPVGFFEYIKEALVKVEPQELIYLDGKCRVVGEEPCEFKGIMMDNGGITGNGKLMIKGMAFVGKSGSTGYKVMGKTITTEDISGDYLFDKTFYDSVKKAFIIDREFRMVGFSSY